MYLILLKGNNFIYWPNNDFKVYVQNQQNDFDFIANESNRFLVDESIFATYSKLNYKLNKWYFSGGLRYEDSDTKGFSTSDNETNQRKITVHPLIKSLIVQTLKKNIDIKNQII